MTKNMKEKKIHTQNTRSLARSLTCVSVRPEPYVCKTSARSRARAAHSSTRRERAHHTHQHVKAGRHKTHKLIEPVTFSLMIFLRHRCPHHPSAAKIAARVVPHDNQQASGSPLACGVNSRAQGQVSHRCGQLALLRAHVFGVHSQPHRSCLIVAAFNSRGFA